MTHDLALKQSIMADVPPPKATGEAKPHVIKRQTPKQRAKRERRERRGRKGRSFFMTLIIRAVMLVGMAVGLRVMMYTPQGQALLQEAAMQLAPVIGSFLAEDEAGEEVISDALQSIAPAPLNGAEQLREGGAGGTNPRPAVSSMPGSQDKVRRLN